MIRPATPGDVEGIHALVCELADFEKLRHAVVSTPADFKAALFGDHPLLEALVADSPSPASEDRSLAKPLAGMALFYPTFSTFTGKPGLWLEDIYVRPEHRGRGLGRAFLERVLALASQRGCARAEWSVLDWNQPALDFYEKFGATILPDWRVARVSLAPRREPRS